VLPALLAPLTAVVSAVGVLRAAALGRRRGGVMWRGTLYPHDALRAGRRLKLG